MSSLKDLHHSKCKQFLEDKIRAFTQKDEFQNYTHLLKRATTYHIPLEYTPFTSTNLQKIVSFIQDEIGKLTNCREVFSGSENKEKIVLHYTEQIDYLNSLVFCKDVPEGYDFTQVPPVHKFHMERSGVKIYAGDILKLLNDHSVELKRGDFVIIKAICYSDNEGCMSVDVDAKGEICLIEANVFYNGYQQPRFFKSIIDFPPIMFMNYRYGTCYIDTKFASQMIETMKREDDGVISMSIVHDNITYNILSLEQSMWNIPNIQKMERYIENTSFSCIPFDEEYLTNPTVNKYYDSNALTTIMVTC